MGKLAKILTAITAALLLAACSDIMSDLKTRSSAGTPAATTTTTPEPAPEQKNAQSTPVTLETPLTLEACVAGAIVTFVNKAAGPVTYKVNGGAAQTIASGDSANITLAAIGDKIEFWGDNKAYVTVIGYSNCSNISCSDDCYLYGNIMSLVKSEGFKDATNLEQSYTFARFFEGNTHIKNKDGAELLLPATSLSSYCYCRMFHSCSSLVTAPALPATSLTQNCYEGMFYGCSSLITAPVLPATSLAQRCYEGMFSGCSELSSVTCLATDISADGATACWLGNVATTGTFTKAPEMNGWTRGANGIPTGWIVLPPESVPLTLEAAAAGAVVTFRNEAQGPVTYKVNGRSAQTIASGESKAITLSAIGDTVEFYGNNISYGYKTASTIIGSSIKCSLDCYVFGNIMSLISGENFRDAKTIAGEYAFYEFFNSSHIKNKDGAELLLPATTLADYCYCNMFYGCSDLEKAPKLPATTLTKGCYAGMFYHCRSLKMTPALPALVMEERCYGSMFYDCASLTTMPELSSTKLANDCYESMFRQCVNLTIVKPLPATSLANNCYAYMFSDCTNLATGPELHAKTLAQECYKFMFKHCPSLTHVTCLATDISASDCTDYWLSDVAASGTFTKAAGMTGWTTGASGIPNGWTVVEK